MKQTLLTLLAAFLLLFSSACASTAAATTTGAQTQAQLSSLQATLAASTPAAAVSSISTTDLETQDTADNTLHSSESVVIIDGEYIINTDLPPCASSGTIAACCSSIILPLYTN